MTIESSVLLALILGLMGSGHCAAMCGGIACTLTSQLAIGRGRGPTLIYLIAYNTGRILSYAAAGVLVGLLGEVAGASVGTHLPPASLRIAGVTVAVTFMLGAGLYLCGFSRAFAYLERWGARLWRYIEPFGRALMPVTRAWQALALGAIWGWLPCGLVYAALALAMTSVDPVLGGAHMLAFGLGTLPALLAIGLGTRWLLRRPSVILRRLAGVLLLVLGIGLGALTALDLSS